MPQGDEQVYVEQVFHGKSANSARTCSPVTAEAPSGAFVTIMPVVLPSYRPVGESNPRLSTKLGERDVNLQVWLLVP